MLTPIQKPLSQKPTGDANSNSAPSVELRKPKRDIDNTSESDCDSGKESRRGPRMAAAQQRRGRATVKRPVKEAGARRTHRWRRCLSSMCQSTLNAVTGY